MLPGDQDISARGGLIFGGFTFPLGEPDTRQEDSEYPYVGVRSVITAPPEWLPLEEHFYRHTQPKFGG